MDWNDRQNDCEAWDRITNYASPTDPDITEEDVELMGRRWAEMNEPCEPGQIKAAIRYMRKCREAEETARRGF